MCRDETNDLLQIGRPPFSTPPYQQALCQTLKDDREVVD
jgi:hypothetical protein